MASETLSNFNKLNELLNKNRKQIKLSDFQIGSMALVGLRGIGL